MESDLELVSRARRGEIAAREQLVRRYLRPAYAIALGLVRNAADAEDLAQQALVNALEKLHQCREPTRFAAWLFQAVRHRTLNFIKQRRTRSALLRPSALEEPHAEPSEVVLRLRLLTALAVLTDVQRDVVLLHDLEDWTHGEIAHALQISEVMSRQHLFVARKALREQLARTSPLEVIHE